MENTKRTKGKNDSGLYRSNTDFTGYGTITMEVFIKLVLATKRGRWSQPLPNNNLDYTAYLRGTGEILYLFKTHTAYSAAWESNVALTTAKEILDWANGVEPTK